MAQEIIAFSLLAVALFYLIKKYFFKNKSNKNCGDDDGCGGCH